MRWTGLFGIAILGCLGCGGGASSKPLPDTVPVTGTVQLDGKPLEFAALTFIPGAQTKGVECTGITDGKGTYTLKQARGKDGAPPGEYKVVIRHPKTEDGTPFLSKVGGEKEGEGAPKGIPRESLPARYSSPEASRLTAVVPAGGGKVDFDLKSK